MINSRRTAHLIDRKGCVYADGRMSFLKLDKECFGNKNQQPREYQVLDGTKYICDYAFFLNTDSYSSKEYSANHCPYKQIDLPDSIIAIGDYSFAGCSKLKTITLPEKLYSIGKNPFLETESLNTIISKSPNYIVDFDCLISKETRSLIHCFHHKSINEKDSKSFTFPFDIIKIGDYSFAGRFPYQKSSAYVQEFTIPETVIHVGEGAFKNNINLKEIVFEGESVIIEKEAFSWCIELKRITLPKGIKRISNRLFEYCRTLSEINIPIGVTEIGDSVFEGCISLNTIEIPCSIEEIGVNPFLNSGVENLINHSNCFEYDNGILYTRNKRKIIACISKSEKIAIPTCVEEIGKSAFAMCEHLEEVTVPSSVKIIHPEAFSGCKALKKVDIEKGGINIIEKNTFSGCTSLQEFRIPDGVTEIGDFAFSGCKSLKTLYSPSTIKYVSVYAFDSHPCPVETTWLPWGIEKNGLPGQKKTMSLEDCGLWMDDYGVVYSKDKKIVIKATKLLEKYSVPEGVTTIENGAFMFSPWQRSLEEIQLPNTLEKIGNNAFAYCNFSEIVLPDSLKQLGNDVFVDCIRLKKVLIPFQVCMMNGNPFMGIYCPTHLNHIPYEVINCSNHYLIEDKLLYTSDHSKIISCLNTDSIRLNIDKTKIIGSFSFASCKAIEIIIHQPVNVIEEKAFSNAKVERVVLPDSLIEIKKHAFEMCLNLKEITIPSSTRQIEDCAFGCPSLARVTINSRDIVIGESAFHSDYLSKIIVPSGCLDYFRKMLPKYSRIITEQ